ncbi:MAG: hypothetical protein KAT29_13680 [Anaerolineales bacterium]|nr:hypothetical protein [Anaerolineales bacterium]
MDVQEAPFPESALEEVENLLFPFGVPAEGILELVIVLEDHDLRVRGFSELLGFVDRTYGRLSPRGIRSYARREDEQVRISEVRSGSYELIIETLANNTEAVTSLVMISLLIKYLPGALESLAASYRDYEEAKFTREKRKQLRKQIEEDEKLQSLDRNKQNQLVRYLDYLYERDRKHLKNVGEFSKRSVIDVLIRIANKVE